MTSPHPNAHSAAGAYTNAEQIARHLIKHGTDAGPRMLAMVRLHSLLLETRIKANASGRPGPRVITGDYRRSWNTRVAQSGGQITGTVGSNAPQGPRLEYGFVGQDRLGRTFDQPPYEHVAPAARLTLLEFREAVERITW